MRNQNHLESDGVSYKAVREETCEGCAFSAGGKQCLNAPLCDSSVREDKRSVIFVRDLAATPEQAPVARLDKDGAVLDALKSTTGKRDAMSEFTADLKALLGVADLVVIEGYEIDETAYYSLDGKTLILCGCGEDNRWYFAEQQVLIQDDVGTAMARLDPYSPKEVRVSLAFYITRPIKEADIPRISRHTG